MSTQKFHDWQQRKLGDVTTIIGGGTPKTTMPSYWKDEIVWLSPTDLPPIGSITYVSDSSKKISRAGLDNSSARLLPKGAVVFSSRASIGKIGICSCELATNQGFTNFICGTEVLNTYLAYCLLRFAPELEALSNSTTFKEVNKTSIRNFTIPLPPLPEQRRIVSKLDALMENIDKAIEYCKKQDQQIAALRAALMDEGFQSKYADVSIKDIATRVQYGISAKMFGKGKYPILRMGNLQDGNIDLTDLKYIDLDTEEFEKYKLERGDILFNRTNSYELVGKTALYDRDEICVFASYLIRLNVDTSRVIPEYVNLYLNSPKVQEQLRSLAQRAISQANINAKKLQGIELPLPPLQEQEHIIKFLNLALKKIAELTKNNSAKKEYLEALKSSLLDSAFSGELTNSEK